MYRVRGTGRISSLCFNGEANEIELASKCTLVGPLTPTLSPTGRGSFGLPSNHTLKPFIPSHAPTLNRAQWISVRFECGPL